MSGPTKNLLAPIILDNDEIEYIYECGRLDRPVKVRLNRRIVGSIKQEPGGFRYFPKGAREGGELFTTFGECQKSLEGTGLDL